MKKTFFHYSFKILKVLFVLIFCGTLISATFLALSAPTVRAAKGNPVPLNFTPQLTIPNSNFTRNASITVGQYDPGSGTMTSDLLVKYIKAFYNYGLGIAGILAAIVLMAGGVLWLTSAGNDTKIGQAKELIGGSITGVAILFCSWIILNTINPDLVNLKPIVTENLRETKITTCCDYNFKKPPKEGVSEDTCLKEGGKFFQKGKALVNSNPNLGICVDSGCCRCRIGGSWKTVWISDSTCLDEKTTGEKVLPNTCEYACELAGTVQKLPSESLFVWGNVCSASGECTFSTGGAGGEF